jgi:hypothetical protein
MGAQLSTCVEEEVFCGSKDLIHDKDFVRPSNARKGEIEMVRSPEKKLAPLLLEEVLKLENSQTNPPPPQLKLLPPENDEDCDDDSYSAEKSNESVLTTISPTKDISQMKVFTTRYARLLFCSCLCCLFRVHFSSSFQIVFTKSVV